MNVASDMRLSFSFDGSVNCKHSESIKKIEKVLFLLFKTFYNVCSE